MTNENEDTKKETTLILSLEKEMQSTPWYLMSAAIHCVLAIIMMFMIRSTPPAQENRIVFISTEIIEEPIYEKEIEIEPEKIVNEKVKVESDIQVDTPVVTTQQLEISDSIETDDNMSDSSALGDKENISDVDAEYAGVPSLMGVGNSGGDGGGGIMGNRFSGGNKSRKIITNGGNRRTESSVDAALKWLALHQEKNGNWDCKKYGGDSFDVAATSLSLLAFLGAGNSESKGTYKDNVLRATKWLIGKIDREGNVGPYRYETPIAVMALSEAYGMSNKEYLKPIVQKIVNNLIAGQCMTGAWDYLPHSDRSDTSVSGWAIMGLKSAKVSYLEVPDKVYADAISYLTKATTETGFSTSYSSKGVNITRGGGSARMTAVALTCLQFMGVPRDNEVIKGAAKQTIRVLPNKNQDFYLTYYQSLGLFQMGVRSEYWKTFNDPMKTSLLSTQVRTGTFEDKKGSWNPEIDPHGKHWGRVGETALGCLILEVYYRFKEIE